MVYKEILGHPGYFASDDGRIWSDKRGDRRELAKFSVRVGRYGDYRRWTTNLVDRRGVKVATLVCEAFHGPRPSGFQVAHLNGDSLDNRAENLAWKTKADNDADKVLHGTIPHGENHSCSKLTTAQVAEIRALAGKVRQAEISQRYGISQGHVSRLINGKRWG